MSFAQAHLAALSVNSKWAAVGISLGFLAFLYIVVSSLGHSWNPLNLAKGTDGPLSTSKFQWLLWLVTVLFVYVALLVIRFRQGNYRAISDIPLNVLIVLGFSTATAVAAKGITVTQLQNNQIDKSQAAGGLFLGDQNSPDIGKVQMLAFTFVAIGVFIAAFFHGLNKIPPTLTLPNIDASLLVLMGLSQGGYLGKKLVSVGSAVLYGISPDNANARKPVALHGSMLGSTQDGSQLTFNGGIVEVSDIASWSDNSIGFTVPAHDVARNTDWSVAQDVPVRVIVNGQPTNTQNFTVNPPVLTSSNPTKAAPDKKVIINGTNLGVTAGYLKFNGCTQRKEVTWTNTEITFKVPKRNPADNLPWPAQDQLVPIEVVVNKHTSNTIDFTVAQTGTANASVGPPPVSSIRVNRLGWIRRKWNGRRQNQPQPATAQPPHGAAPHGGFGPGLECWLRLDDLSGSAS